MPYEKYKQSDCLSWVNEVTVRSFPEPFDNWAMIAPPPPAYCSVEPASTSEDMVNQQESGLVGLVNQAMTCYLNSLLQTLYMTPEFRNALYRWEFDGSEDEAKSIPFQLQRLFLQLQTSRKAAVLTTELTKSFGWDSSEAWQQHDVQELCRVMFDALERKFRNTDQADLISRLYEGKLKDYVKCLECGNESAREDTYLDIPLVVRPWGSSEAYGSVEEAIAAFVTPEKLDGSNQYSCEVCKKKCDAHKGLKFLKLPYLLTMQLKRFDFDPTTMHRIKLNDRVTFPNVLDMSEFLKPDSSESEANDDTDTTDSGSALDDYPGCFGGSSNSGSIGSKASPSLCGSEADEMLAAVEDDEGIVVEHRVNHAEADKGSLLKVGDKSSLFQYELFSIMVHSGSANGGHYYAYIKSFVDGEWYCFNDVQVNKVTYDEIRKTYGGGQARGSYYSSSYSSSTNAYMLMYRQIDKERNTEPISSEHLPSHLKALLKSMEESEEQEKKAKELERSMCKIKLFCHHPVKKHMVELKMKIHKDDTLAEATNLAHIIMTLGDSVDIENCRLVKYNEFDDSLECSFEGMEDSPMEEILGGVKTNYKFELLLEIRKPNEPFLVYKPGGTTVKVHVVDIENGDIGSPVTVRSHLHDTVAALKAQIAQVLELPSTKMRLAVERCSNDLKFLTENDETLQHEGFDRSNKVYLEYKDEDDEKCPFRKSKFFNLIVRHKHTISFTISLPKVDKDVLSSLGIPSSSEQNKYSPTEDAVTSDDSGCLVLPLTDRSKSPNQYKPHGIASTSYPCDDSQDLDEGLGDSASSLSGYQNVAVNSGSVVANSDQSEDSSLSSLTDSERTLVGDELSPRNNSPDIDCQDVFENDSSSHAAAVHQRNLETSGGWGDESEQKPYYWDVDSDNQSPQQDVHSFDSAVEEFNDVPEETKRHFKAWPFADSESGLKMLRVNVDKRITLGGLKRELEPWVGVNVNYFKLYKIYSNNQEFECSTTDNLMAYTDETRLAIKLGRALQKGEYRVKIYQLLINESEPIKFLIEWVFAAGMTVLQAKREILPELRDKIHMDVPINRCRLRKKSWKNPGTIFQDQMKFEVDIPIYPSWEVFLEVLSDCDKVISNTQLSLLTRHWHPSTYTLDPFQEIILDESTVQELKQKVSEFSGIPEDYLEFAKGQGSFPYDVQLLTVHVDLDWNLDIGNIAMCPLYIKEDGHVIFYKDCREELKQLSDEEKREISTADYARCNRLTKPIYSPRKEKALKIYTDSPPKALVTFDYSVQSKMHESSNNSTSISSSASKTKGLQ